MSESTGVTTEEYTADQIKYSKELMAEEPKISAAVKNFLAMQLTATTAAPATDDSEAKISEVTDGGNGVKLDAACLTPFARALLQAINAFTVPTPPEWGAKHPQGEDELGMARIDTLAKRVVLRDLADRVASQKGKLTQLFGKAFLEANWDDIRGDVERSMAAKGLFTAAMTEEMLEEFLLRFESTLGDSDSGACNRELVWATDFQAVLQKRHAARKAVADKRMGDMESEFKGMVSSLVQGAKEDGKA